MPQRRRSSGLAALSRRETALTRRYLRVLEKWVPVGLQYFEDWPRRPRCGHFLGGCHWYGMETLAGAQAFAAAASSPELDERTIGCSRAHLQEVALRALRYLCFTHDTGPEDCVRPAHGLGRPENCHTKWGERGLGFFKESQCGSTVAGMGIVALLLGDSVDAETWDRVRAVHADYAARFGTMAPRSGVYYDTQMEENAWTAYGLAAVECLLADQPQAATWAETTRQWLFAAAAAPQDAKDLGPLEDSTVAQFAGRTFTTLPDYMAENHGVVHPSYTGSALMFLTRQNIVYALHGRALPPPALHNRQRIYDQLKLTTDSSGSMHPVQGMDWPYLMPDPGTGCHAAAAVILRDGDGAALERRALSTLEARQHSNGGRLIDADLATSVHGIQDPLIIREALIGGPAMTYLLHRLLGDGARPTAERELERRLRGVRVYPHSGFVFHRHARGQTSLSWRNSITALPLNRDGLYTVAPAADSWLARVEVKGHPASQEQISVATDAQDDGFATSMVLHRAQGTLRQEVLFAGLPNGISLSWERLTATRAITVERADQGFLRLINEKYSAIKGNCNGTRTLHTPEGSERFAGFAAADPDSDVEREYAHPAWVNVDGRLGLVFAGTGQTQYVNRHHYPIWWALADDLTLSRLVRPLRAKAGDLVGQLAAAIVPGYSPAQTAGLALIRLRVPRQAAALILGDHLAAANFADRARTLKLGARSDGSAGIPVFSGTTRLDGGASTHVLRLQAGGTTLRRALCRVRVQGRVEVTAAEDGRVMAWNAGDGSATVRVAGSDKPVRMRPGASALLR